MGSALVAVKSTSDKLFPLVFGTRWCWPVLPRCLTFDQVKTHLLITAECAWSMRRQFFTN